MFVYIVTCTDPADRGSECWAHGVYRTKAQALRVCRRLANDSYLTVRFNRRQLRAAPQRRDREEA